MLQTSLGQFSTDIPRTSESREGKQNYVCDKGKEDSSNCAFRNWFGGICKKCAIIKLQNIAKRKCTFKFSWNIGTSLQKKYINFQKTKIDVQILYHYASDAAKQNSEYNRKRSLPVVSSVVQGKIC